MLFCPLGILRTFQSSSNSIAWTPLSHSTGVLGSPSTLLTPEGVRFARHRLPLGLPVLISAIVLRFFSSLQKVVNFINFYLLSDWNLTADIFFEFFMVRWWKNISILRNVFANNIEKSRKICYTVRMISYLFVVKKRLQAINFLN